MTTLSETNSYVTERKALFKLEPNRSYMLELEYSGDMYNIYGEEEPCSYFDLVISINALKDLGNKLSCSAHPTIQDAESLVAALPGDIESRDLPI